MPLGLIATAFSAGAVIQSKVHGSGLNNEALKDTVYWNTKKNVFRNGVKGRVTFNISG